MDAHYPTVLSIAGSDSGGGAGIQADIKTISALGCYAATAITAVTVQDTKGVFAIWPVPPQILESQIKAVVEDICPAVIKIGMTYNAGLINAIASVLKECPGIPIILDPVMAASSGQSLAESGFLLAMASELFPLARLVTPNIDEAAALAIMPVKTVEDMKQAALKILQMGSYAVLIKGGHLTGEDLYDFYVDKTGAEQLFQSKKIVSNNTHGTGCTLSSAIASFLALGEDLITSIGKAKTYVHLAIEAGQEVKTGKGHGPLNHFFDPVKMVKKA